jgi:transcription termination/antitermination protein NusG
MMHFYLLRVASNREDRVREQIARKVKIEGLEDVIGQVLVPTEAVRSMKGGVKRESDRKLYPGYVVIELAPNPDGRIPEKAWFLIKEVDGVGDFYPIANGKPIPMTPADKDKIVQAVEAAADTAPRLDTRYNKGDKVKVTNGPFENFEGEVDEILGDQGKVRIITTIFGRPTPLELEYWQIEKL